MKKSGLLIGVVLTLFVLIVAFNINLTSGNNNDGLAFQNVEALAQGEGGGLGNCLGNGSLQCPEFDVKVYIYMVR